MTNQQGRDRASADELMRGLKRMGRDGAYKRKHGQSMEAAIDQLVRSGVPLSSAKKKVKAEAEALADAEDREQAGQQNAYAESLRAMSSGRQDLESPES